MAEPGLRPITVGLILGRLPAQTRQGALVAADLDWVAFPGRDERLFADLPHARRPRRTTAGADLRATVRSASAADRDRIVLDRVRAEVAAVLASGTEDVDVTSNLPDLGITSLTAMELSAVLRAETGVELTPAAVFEHPTPQALAAYLSGRLMG